MHIVRNINFYLNYREKHRFLLFLEAVRRKSHSEKSNFPERFVKIQTCGKVYRKWRDEKLYTKLPEGDITFQVPYVDTRPNEMTHPDFAHPTVLALHGAPGSWRDFIYLISYLHERGCRVIAPYFPDFYTCKPGIFRHSHVEKAQYVKDFLSAISVSKIDLLTAHSSSVYPALDLCLDQKPVVKSLALLNPATFSVKEMSATTSFQFLKLFVAASENPVSMKFLKVFSPFIIKNILKSPLRFENILDPLLSATTMRRGGIEESEVKFKLVSHMLPIFYVFSEKDPLISTKPSYELAELLGAKFSDIYIYNKEGQLVQEGFTKPTLKVLGIQQGSHYAFLKYPELINREIVDFLKSQKIL